MQAAAATTHAPAAARVGASRSRAPASCRCAGAPGCRTHQWVSHCSVAAAPHPVHMSLTPRRPSAPRLRSAQLAALEQQQVMSRAVPLEGAPAGQRRQSAAPAPGSPAGTRSCVLSRVCVVCSSSAWLAAGPLSSCCPPSASRCSAAGCAAAGCPPRGAGQQRHRAGGGGGDGRRGVLRGGCWAGRLQGADGGRWVPGCRVQMGLDWWNGGLVEVPGWVASG